MKITLRQLKYKCVEVNKSMRGTRFGVAVDRYGDDIAVTMKYRRPGMGDLRIAFSGTAKEADSYLDGLRDGVECLLLQDAGVDTQDGSDV